jgi:hypothetical protein
VLRSHITRASAGSGFSGIVDSHLDHNCSNTATQVLDPDGGAAPLLLLTFSRRYVAFSTPTATVASTADTYNELDSNSVGPFNAYGGSMQNVWELADVEDSSTITAGINNSGSSGFSVSNTFAALLMEGFSSSATLNDVVTNTSSDATISEDIDVVYGGVVIILAGIGSTQSVTENGTSLLGSITQTASDGGHILYYAPVLVSGTATIQSVISDGTSEGLILVSVAP